MKISTEAPVEHALAAGPVPLLGNGSGSITSLLLSREMDTQGYKFNEVKLIN